MMASVPELRPVRLAALTSAGIFEVSVSNGGLAIPTPAMERLFQPFFRGDSSQKSEGLGLGLHIASEIAKAHGRTLSVSSDEKETCFTFRMLTATIPSP
jgi:sigma-B regulation protein RsbU (phosphoserine phosphatase)